MFLEQKESESSEQKESESSEQKEFMFPRKLRTISNGIGFSIPDEIVDLMDDKPRGKTWNIILREA